MKYTIILTFILLMMASQVSAASDLYLGKVWSNPTNDNVLFKVNMQKTASKKIDNLKVRLFVPELNLLSGTSRFGISDYDNQAKTLKINTQTNTQNNGWYLARLSVTNSGDKNGNNVKRIKFVPIRI